MHKFFDFRPYVKISYMIQSMLYSNKLAQVAQLVRNIHLLTKKELHNKNSLNVADQEMK